MNLSTPREIDEAISAASHVLVDAEARLVSSESTMRTLYTTNVLKKRVEYGRTSEKFPYQATPEAAAAWFASMEPGRDMFEFSNYRGKVADQLAKRDQRIIEVKRAEAALDALEALYTGWSRFFMVTSSAGHVHRSRACHTCSVRTTFGWIPELASKSDDEALAWFTEKGYPSVLCSVCFPDAPVQYTGGKITVARAKKLAA